MILAPAIKYENEWPIDRPVIYTLPKPNRHIDIYSKLIIKDNHKAKYGEGTYGFLTDSGEFLDRLAAGYHALDMGQVKDLEPGEELYTERLY